jgi:hypothetical protein
MSKYYAYFLSLALIYLGDILKAWHSKIRNSNTKHYVKA